MSLNSVSQSQRDVSRRLVTDLWRGGAYSYWYRIGPDHYTDKAGTDQLARESQWFSVEKPAPIPAHFVEGDVYLGVHPVDSIPTATRKDGRPVASKWLRSRIANVSAVNCLFSEYDLKQYGSHDAIMAHLDGLDCYPTVTVNSGIGGVHAYWLFCDPQAVTDDNRAEFRLLQSAWVSLTGGDDGAKDLARVLRVPGTRNRKYEGAPKVTILEFGRNRYFDFDRLADLAGDHIQALRIAEQRQRDIDTQRESGAPAAGAADFLLRWAIDHAHAGSRHSMALWLAGRLKKEGVPKMAAVAAVAEFAAAVSGAGTRQLDTGEAAAAVKWAWSNT